MEYENVFKREHPVYAANKEIWKRSQEAYAGGKAYIDKAVIQHVSEVDLEFAERQKRAYYFNYPRKIARLITQFVLAKDPTREGANPDVVEDFSRTGLRVNEVMRQFSTFINVYGAAWLAVDMPNFKGELDQESKTTNRIRPYATALSPLSVVDWAYGADGLLQWVIAQETMITNDDPFKAREVKEVRRVWTRDKWMLLGRDESNKIQVIDQNTHNLGMVPFVHHEDTDGFGMDANHWFEDVVRISDAILNNESEAQMNIVKQMFGLLVVSESFARGGATPRTETDSDGNETTKFSHVLARSAAIWETTEENGISRYIAPDGASTDTIRQENTNLKKEMFDVIGMAVQKDTKEAQTAESKAWDNLNVKQYLATRADILEQAEQKAWSIMNAWDSTITEPEIVYNREFDVQDIKDTISALMQLDNSDVGIEFKKQIQRTKVNVLDKIDKIPTDTRKDIAEEIDNMQPEPEPELPTFSLNKGSDVDTE
jgi:hypothetical protein